MKIIKLKNVLDLIDHLIKYPKQFPTYIETIAMTPIFVH